LAVYLKEYPMQVPLLDIEENVKQLVDEALQEIVETY